LVVVGVVAAAGAYTFLERRLTAAYDLDLADIARTVVPYLRLREGKLVLAFNPEAESVLRADSTDQIHYAVFGADGGLIAGDATLPRPLVAPSQSPQFWDDVHQGQRIRAVSIAGQAEGVPVHVVATETRRKRDLASRDAALSAIIPATLLSVAAIVAVLLGVRRGLGPVEALRRELQSRSHVDLRPVNEGGVVMELQPLVHELNNMLLRLEGAQSSQARFIANAAHQLRTPIAGLVTQLDLARGGEGSARDAHVERAREGAARLARLAQQILSLAAADPISNPAVPQQACDLADIVKDHAGTWLRSAAPRGVEIEFDLAPAAIHGNPVLVGELASNLVHNAARYGAKTVTVKTGVADAEVAKGAGAAATGTSAGAAPPTPVFEVIDDGPGIAAADRTRIFERFRRLDEESTEGSGLGLAIVNEIAQRHGATVEVGEGERGLGTRVTVRFPATRRPEAMS
jgi:two-component system sensor histidine kinase TctE